jgi:hypothetical protein
LIPAASITGDGSGDGSCYRSCYGSGGDWNEGGVKLAHVAIVAGALGVSLALRVPDTGVEDVLGLEEGLICLRLDAARAVLAVAEGAGTSSINIAGEDDIGIRHSAQLSSVADIFVVVDVDQRISSSHVGALVIAVHVHPGEGTNAVVGGARLLSIPDVAVTREGSRDVPDSDLLSIRAQVDVGVAARSIADSVHTKIGGVAVGVSLGAGAHV